MLHKSPITGRYYKVETLKPEEKLRLGFEKDLVDELKKVPEAKKKAPVKEQKEPKKTRKKKVDG